MKRVRKGEKGGEKKEGIEEGRGRCGLKVSKEKKEKNIKSLLLNLEGFIFFCIFRSLCI